jgi:hypothetical protein
MKLKEWGFMRHKPRRAGASKNDGKETSASPHQQEDDEPSEEELGAAPEPMSIDVTSEEATPRQPTYPPLYQSQRKDHCDEHGRWRLASEEQAETLPTFMGLLGKPAK